MRLELQQSFDFISSHVRIIIGVQREPKRAAGVYVCRCLALSNQNFGEPMFEDSLVESTGRIRTRSRMYAGGSFMLQAALLAVVILIPYLYPAALPPGALSIPLVAPPPLATAAPAQHAAMAHAAHPVQTIAIAAPRIIPRHVMMGETTSTAPPRVDDLTGIGRGDVIGAMPAIGPPPAAPVVVQPKPATPLRVSAGVAAGQLLTPIQPVYPFLAKATHVQGTVVIEALISKQGLVEQARVLRGPPLLAQAALSAVNAARYRPYRLNGQPVEVETTISIIFTMGD